jgi:hypothetical protein
MSAAWSDREVLNRLRAVVCDVPEWGGSGGGTQSASIHGMASYARDMAIVQRVMRKVISGLLAPKPHPCHGDGGYREEMREQALEALDWAEQWHKWRNKSGWTAGENGRCNYGERPWDLGGES